MSTKPKFFHPWLAILAVAAWCTAASAMALEADQVRGIIQSVSPEQDQLTLKVTDAGSDLATRQGRTETYQLDPDTRIRMQDRQSTLLHPAGLTINDLRDGTHVLLDFEDVNGQRMARNVGIEQQDTGSSTASSGSESGTTAGATAETGSGEQSSDVAAMESGGRNSLPSTASVLPLLAMLGAGFAGLGTLLRIRRRRF